MTPPQPSTGKCKLRLALCILHFLFVSRADGQSTPPQQRLLDSQPFDRITLQQSADGTTLDVLPLELPQRPLAAIPTTGKLTLRLTDRPTEEFELAWSDVARVQVFEELLFEEARRLTAAGQFDEAYDYFARLSSQHPSLPGLDEAIGDYLRRNAFALYQARDPDRALALLLTLYQRNPKATGLDTAVEKVAGEIIERYLREGNYAAARSVLVFWQTEFRGLAASAAADWQRRFEAAAAKQASEAGRLVQEKQYIPARKYIAKAQAIWPELSAAKTLSAQIQREFPFVTVGVFEAAPRQLQPRIDCWPAIRASRLTGRLLAEEIGFGAEGGQYVSPFGRLTVDESGRELRLTLDGSARVAGLSAHSLARYLLSIASPTGPRARPDFASLVSGIAIGPPDTVQLHLSRIHVRPESLLQVPPPTDVNSGNFTVADATLDQTVFTSTAPVSARQLSLQAVVEQTLADDEAAVDALLAGDIDVLDRVPPWQLERLRAASGVRVEPYRLPTVHVLIPNANRPLLTQREFRRALCFGIDRRWIVDRVILGGSRLAGFEAVSGPFPAGTSLSDPIRYGYNNKLTPRSFEPRLAAILATVAWSNVQSAEDKEKNVAPPELPKLTLAHPAEPVARLACRSIQAQLKRQGIAIDLREFTANELVAGRVDCDLRYGELAVWEPVTDARRLLGPSSLTSGLQTPYLNSALRQLDEASNWNDVRARLIDIHEIVHHDLNVIPLWQTINYFACRASVRGIGESPLTLYQNIDSWTPASASNVAQRDPR